jgi:Ca2+-binding EF-hand superfamily protein
MKGLEGEADANQDGKITIGEMQDYLSDKVARQATALGRKQNTQLLGDSNRILVGR